MRGSKSQVRYSAERPDEPLVTQSLTPVILKERFRNSMDDDYGIGNKTATQTLRHQDDMRNSIGTIS